MTIYNLDKGANNDINGDVLRNWLNTNKANIHNLTIKDKGIATIENMANLCYQFNNLTSVDLSGFNTANVTNISHIFVRCNNLASISNFNTSNVIDMTMAFSDVWGITTIPNFNTAKVTSMSEMFRFCKNLTTVPNFDTSNVTDMFSMFGQCTNLVDIPQFDVSNLEYIDRLVQYCNNLSNASIQNIINMCLNSNITNSTLMNLNNTNDYSPFYSTKFNTMYYENRQDELEAAGWSFEPYTNNESPDDNETPEIIPGA